MPMPQKEFLNLLADALAVDPDELTETSTFDEVGGMDSVSRLSMISMLESHFGADAVFDNLKTINDVPSLLTEMRSRGLVD